MAEVMAGVSCNFEPLLERATPDIYRSNAFRVLGLPAVTTLEEIEQRWDETRIKLGLGWEVSFPGYAFPLAPASDATILEEAYQRLDDPLERFLEEFFWFWPDESGSDLAISALESGDAETAKEIWTLQESSGDSGVAPTHNLAVLYHLRAIELELKNLGARIAAGAEQRDHYWLGATRRWKSLVKSEEFWAHTAERIRRADHPRLDAGVGRQMRETLPCALASISVRLALLARRNGRATEAERLNTAARGFAFGREVMQAASKQIVRPLKRQLEELCAEAKDHSLAERQDAARAASALQDRAFPLIGDIDLLLDYGDRSRALLHDKLARTTLLCVKCFLPFAKNWSLPSEILGRAWQFADDGPARKEISLILKYFRDYPPPPPPPPPGAQELETLESKVNVILVSGSKARAKFELLQNVIRKQELEKFKLTWGEDSEVFVKASNAVARCARKIAVDLLEEGDPALAREALDLARGLCRGSRDLLRLIEEAALKVEAGALTRRIKAACDEAARVSGRTPELAERAARRQIAESRSAFAEAAGKLPAGHSILAELSDKVVLTALDCVTVFGNQTQNWPACLDIVGELLDFARETSPGRKAREEIDRRQTLFQNNQKIAETKAHIASLLRPLSELCARAVNAAAEDPARADRMVELLAGGAPPLLDTLAHLPPEWRGECLGAYDKVSLAILECSGLFGSKTQKWDACLAFIETARGFASSESVRREVDSRQAFARSRDEANEISFHTALLKEVSESASEPARKLSRLREEVLPRFEELKRRKGERSRDVVAVSDMLAHSLLGTAAELYADPRAHSFGDEAVALAESLAPLSGTRADIREQVAGLRKYKAEMVQLQAGLTPVAKTPDIEAETAQAQAGLPPVAKTPGIEGGGVFKTKFHSQQDPDSRGQTFATTLYLFFFNLPLIPLGRYRVMRGKDGVQHALGKLALRPVEKLRIAGVAAVLGFILSLLGWYLFWP